MSPAQAAFDTHAEVRKLKQAGCPEAQAQAMVDLVTQAPANPQITEDMEGLKTLVQGVKQRVEGIEHRVGVIEHRVEVIENTMATKADLEILRNQTFARIESLRAKTIELNMGTHAWRTAARGGTKATVESLHAETRAAIEGLRGDIGHVIWLQLATILAALVLAIATTLLT